MERKYVIKGTNGFYDVDNNSGYPYKSNFRHYTFSSFESAYEKMQDEKEMSLAGVKKPMVCEIKYEPVDVSCLEKDYVVVDDIIESMTQDQIYILKSKLFG